MRSRIEMGMAAALLGALCWAAPAGRGQDKDGLYTASHQQLDAVKVILMQEKAWNRGNLDEFLESFKDDPETVSMLGKPVRGMANIKSAFHITYPNRESMGALAYSDVEARELGENYELATGRYHLERTKHGGGSADGAFTEVLEKTLLGWKIIFSETT